MKFKLESIVSKAIHAVTELKIKIDDPIKRWFSSINWSFISSLCANLYSSYGAPAYNPVSMFKHCF